MITRSILAFLVLAAASMSLALAQADPAQLVQDGDLYLSQGDCELAQYFYQEALKDDAGNVAALVGKGKALACRGALALAITEFETALELDARNISAYVQLARTYESQYLSDPERFADRLEAALETLGRAEAIAPDSAQVLNTRGVILYQMADLEGARAALQKAINLADGGSSDIRGLERSVILVNLGKVHRDLGDLEQARDALRRAVVTDPTNASAHNNLGNIYYRLGNCDEAEYELRQATTLDPNSLSAVSQLAIALFECGDVLGSVPVFEQAIQLQGSILAPPLYTYLSRGYVEQERFNEAVQRAQQGALLPPESAEAYYFLGQAYVARGNSSDTEAARRAYQRALEIDPNYGPAQQGMNELP